MMLTMIFFFWVVIFGFLETVFPSGLNLLAVLAVFSGLRKGLLGGVLIGGGIGLFAEIFSAADFGLNIALYSMVGFMAGFARSRIFYKENTVMEFVFSFCGVLLFYLGYFILTRTAYASMFSTALFSAALAPVVFNIAGKKQAGKV